MTAATTSAFACMNIARRGFTVSDETIDDELNSLVNAMTPRMPTMTSTLPAPELAVDQTSARATGMFSPASSESIQPIIRLLSSRKTIVSTPST